MDKQETTVAGTNGKSVVVPKSMIKSEMYDAAKWSAFNLCLET